MHLYCSIRLAKLYFIESEERWSALLLLISGVITTIGLVVSITCISLWTSTFWTALATMNSKLFMKQLIIFAGIVTGAVICDSLNTLIVHYLSIRWRNWFTKFLLKKYLLLSRKNNQNENNFLDLLRLPGNVQNPQQTIQQDVKTFTDGSVSMFLGFLSSTLQFACTVGGLWVIGGALTFTVCGSVITIPGFLVWATILVSSLASAVTHAIGKHLSKIMQRQETKEAELRKELEQLNQQSESIALEMGYTYYQSSLNKKMDELTEISTKKLKIQIKIAAFHSFYGHISRIFPYLVSAPLYFNKIVNLGVFMQIGFMFSQVSNALNWFVYCYEQLSFYHSSAKRLIQLHTAMSTNGHSSANKKIKIESSENIIDIKIKNINTCTPDNSRKIFKNLSLHIKKGENTLIEGDNGCGKSTLFKVMAGTWRYGEGKVNMPKNAMFISQKIVIPDDTLRSILAYPRESRAYTSNAYKQVLKKVKLSELINHLDTPERNWPKTLSQGEQQKIGFARTLLQQPHWLFLDEATASLSEDCEKQMYQTIKQTLPDTTIISIGHRANIRQFHENKLFFKNLTMKCSAT